MAASDNDERDGEFAIGLVTCSPQLHDLPVNNFIL
jgi:hypothetical protein